MSKLKDLQQAEQAIRAVDPFGGGVQQLGLAVEKALAVAGPVGSPGAIRERAKAYAETAKAYAKASEDLGAVATSGLPSVWTGSVAEHATQAVKALANELAVSQKALQQGASLLGTWADDLEWAQNTDTHGVDSLNRALSRCAAPSSPPPAWNPRWPA
ncbi:hypothetical protein ACFVHB_26730 [Kitasatospora sp. NPDC127111]|uniref:hypothetical protein n=1 Tax=Kitasatospora sp. NPDC127111 TaxID=3345363 RepID=UPI0036336FF1